MDRRSRLLAALVLVAVAGVVTAGVVRLAGRGTRGGTGAAQDEGPPVVLRGDGLGALPFGAPVDEVIAGLTLRWAPPTSDTGWIEARSSPFGVCPGAEVRAVGWGGFSVLFSDQPTPQSLPGGGHFFSWRYEVADPAHPAPDGGVRSSRPTLRTERGVSVGSTVAQLRRAYGAELELSDEGPEGPRFSVQRPEGGIFGSVTNVQPSGVVLTIVSGGACGE